MTALLENKIVAGVIAGVAAAVLVDVAAFRSWKRWQDARTYDWGVASFRWCQGALMGALTAVGLGVATGDMQ